MVCDHCICHVSITVNLTTVLLIRAECKSYIEQHGVNLQKSICNFEGGMADDIKSDYCSNAMMLKYAMALASSILRCQCIHAVAIALQPAISWGHLHNVKLGDCSLTQPASVECCISLPSNLSVQIVLSLAASH